MSIIADCAIDPHVFAQWQHFQSLIEEFGVSEGRLISEFPGKWRKRVIDQCDRLVQLRLNSEIQRARITEYMADERFRRKLKGSNREYNPDDSWETNAQRAHPPFDLVIVEDDVLVTNTNTVCANTLCKWQSPFYRSTQKLVPRTAQSLVEAARILLTQNNLDLILVDPNFRADEPRFYNPLRHIISTVNDAGIVLRRLEIHTNKLRNKNDIFNPRAQRNQWFNYIFPYLPKSWILNICYWDELPWGGRPHARLLLTQSGGMCYDYGFDEGDGRTQVSTLDDEIWSHYYNVFNVNNLPNNFDRDNCIFTSLI